MNNDNLKNSIEKSENLDTEKKITKTTKMPGIYIYIYIYINCLCGSVAKASDTETVGHGFDPRPDH